MQESIAICTRPDGFTIAREADGWQVTARRGGVEYRWPHTFGSQEYARHVVALAAPWPVAWLEQDGELIGTRDSDIGTVRDA